MLDAFARSVVTEEDYREQARQIEAEITAASAEMIEATVDERELQGTLDFAETLLDRPGRAWHEFTLAQRRRFQLLVFPEGVAVDRGGSPVKATMSPVFNYLPDLASEEVHLVAQAALTWNQLTRFLRDLEVLRAA